MPKVTYIKSDGVAQTLDVPVGYSVMEGAVKNSVRGIDGDCGGACACATCHVYVDPQWVDKLAPKDESEIGMLDFAVEPLPNSRLSCQLKVSAALDGLVVRLPRSQH
jgi:2Fe-2S ferredoxin